ncbi:MAG: hypothetical protein P3T54_04565 [Dehalogenimonas sp.]|uniref:Uncharacterized protein n=1 Tax=Candidatus Dehalogenimonas loeffleri TaxID=3127115 RepID=A0ABZ2J675_9CHLR|nr:hypothetical protein [Dehalogenimonas sp.]
MYYLNKILFAIRLGNNQITPSGAVWDSIHLDLDSFIKSCTNDGFTISKITGTLEGEVANLTQGLCSQTLTQEFGFCLWKPVEFDLVYKMSSVDPDFVNNISKKDVKILTRVKMDGIGLQLMTFSKNRYNTRRHGFRVIKYLAGQINKLSNDMTIEYSFDYLFMRLKPVKDIELISKYDSNIVISPINDRVIEFEYKYHSSLSNYLFDSAWNQVSYILNTVFPMYFAHQVYLICINESEYKLTMLIRNTSKIFEKFNDSNYLNIRQRIRLYKQASKEFSIFYQLAADVELIRQAYNSKAKEPIEEEQIKLFEIVEKTKQSLHSPVIIPNREKSMEFLVHEMRAQIGTVFIFLTIIVSVAALLASLII